MRHIIITTVLLLCGMQLVYAQQDCVSADGLRISRDGSRLSVGMTIDLSGLEVGRNRAVVITPRLTNGTDSVELPSIGVYGRKRYYYYVRNGGSILSGNDGMTYKACSAPQTVEYSREVAYAPWMDGSRLTLHREDYGCCNTILDECDRTIGGYMVYVPPIVYVRPQAVASKMRSLEGSAYIDFPVNRTEIDPTYRDNQSELAIIRATIDSVRNDKDVTITSVWLKGYASPEGSYYHNKNLAMGRTEAIKDYVQKLYNFGDGVITTDYEPEDWAGMKRFVEKGELQYRLEILAIIDDQATDPDAKEKAIRNDYPEDYKILLTECFPALRHTDYKVSYNVRTYSDVREIKEIMRTQPQKLSLDELYQLAGEYESGSAEFTEVFETAVRMYPDDETANLNAANAAMDMGDLSTASHYLEKAGTSGEAEYARGVCAYKSENYPAAKKYMQKAADMGVSEAKEMMSELRIMN